MELKPEDVTAIAVYSDMEQTGFFESSNQLLNRFVDATIWSTKGNSLDIPTDCPTRERHGWTGDAHIFFETANYLFDYATFSQKYLRDIYGWRLGTGFLSTPLILDMLAEYDLEAAYRLLENEEIPGWLFMPKNGATTIWESWEGTHAQGGIASLNHYSKGAVCEWLFKTMCGIRVDGENHFVIAPRPGGSFTYAKAAYNSIYGKVECGWEKTDAGCRFRITIPSNTTATVILPSGTIQNVTAGELRKL